MTAVKVNFEIGHEASVRTKKTPEGFTHDWEVFVRGQEGADISHFVEKVVFHLHETFPKPRRVVKEPPFSIKESGYASFFIPIEIYLKNREEPKKIKFSYDLTLQQSGFLKDRYIFQNPSEEFKKKLFKGGGITVNNNAFYTNPDQECRSRDSFTEEKHQLVSKPKLSSETPKKHKSKEHKDDVPHRTTSSFENLFGPPIQKPPKVSPNPKTIDKNNTATLAKSDKKEKDRSNSDKKLKHEHKEAKPEKVKVKEDKDKLKSDKVKSHKDGERSKEKSSSKRPSERLPSPEAKKRCPSPNRKQPSPAARSSSSTSLKEEYKIPKPSSESFDPKKVQKTEEKSEPKTDKEAKEKRKKEKKSHDKDKERKEKKEHKKDSHKSKESQKEPLKEIPKEIPKPKENPKEKEVVKEPTPVKEKVKPERPNKFSIENLKKTPQDHNSEKPEEKVKEKDPERKHKHKKKDKKKDESREKHKDSSKEKKHKHDKVKEVPPEPVKTEPVERRETPVIKERPVPEPASPISIDTASQCSSKSGVAKTSSQNEAENSSHSETEDSIEDEEEPKVKVEEPSPEPVKDPTPEPTPDPVVEAPAPQKEKSKKHKDKSSKREEKKRKRKAAEEEEENRKMAKLDTSVKTEPELGESSGLIQVQDNGISSSLGGDAESGEISPDYMVRLRGLQQRIMTIKSNEELERVVNLIAETGRYEVTTQTFDFDLCLLDRSTVHKLIQLVGC